MRRSAANRQTDSEMSDEELARLCAHSRNIARYRRLLETHLTDHERDYMQKRLSEECSIVENLTAAALPVTLSFPASIPVRPRSRHISFAE